MNISSSIIERRKRRWLDFYAGDTDTRILYWIHCFPDLGERPLPNPDLLKERIEWSWRKYQAQCEQLDWLEDDSLPFLDVYTGTEIFAEALGCKVYRPDDNNPFAIPFVHTAQDAERIWTPRLEDTPLMLLFEIADELRRRGGPGALLKMVDMQSPMDIVAQMWDKTELFVAMLETPDAVGEAMEIPQGGLADRGAGGRGVHVHDVGADGDVDGDRDAEARPGGADAERGVRQLLLEFRAPPFPKVVHRDHDQHQPAKDRRELRAGQGAQGEVAGNDPGHDPWKEPPEDIPLGVPAVVGHGEQVSENQHRQQGSHRGLGGKDGRHQRYDQDPQPCDPRLRETHEERGQDNLGDLRYCQIGKHEVCPEIA